MTEILSVAKQSDISGLYMFCEYTMATEEKYSEYWGFIEKEAALLSSVFDIIDTSPCEKIIISQQSE